MLFFKRFTIIFITRSQLRAAVFSSRGKLIREIGQYDWTKETLAELLKEISASGPSRTRVVFGEGFSYVATLPSTEKERAEILKEAQEIIPETLEGNWDFKTESKTNQAVQIAAIRKTFFDTFRKSFEEAGLWVEAAEPQSLVLARLLPKAGTFVFIAKDERTLFGAVKNGAVIGTYLCEDEKAPEVLSQFLAFTEKRCGIKPQAIYIDTEINAQARIFSESGCKIESMELNPLRGMALKKDFSGRDADVMNIVFNKEPVKKEKTFSIVSKREKVLGLIFLVGLILVAAVFVVKFWKK